MEKTLLSSPKLLSSRSKVPIPLAKYYPGYSQEFVGDAFDYLGIEKSTQVLDPWGGFGTTAWVAQKRGSSIILNDLNPVMSIASGATDFALTKVVGQFDVERLSEMVLGIGNIKVSNNLPDWLPPILTSRVVAGIKAVVEDGLYKKDGSISSPHAFLITILFSLMKQRLTVTKSSNPTYSKLDAESVVFNEVKTAAFRKLFNENLKTFSIQLERFHQGSRGSKLKVLNGNSRAMRISSNSIDAVITSPPYCTRIDYAKMTSIELVLLGLAEVSEFESVRRGLMGSPTVNKRQLEVSSEWGVTCGKLLKSVWKHKSVGSQSYYFKNFCQYFDDAYESLRETSRCLKMGGKGFIVVQNSFYKEHEIKLSRIYEEMSDNLGLFSRIIDKHHAKAVIAHSHPQAKEYSIRPRAYAEDIVFISKR